MGRDFKRITPEEAVNYTPLISGDPLLMKKAVAYTLTPCLEPGYEGWEDVTYYTDDSIPSYELHPLEIMYSQWKDLDAMNRSREIKGE